ncbi:MAG: PAS domain-containing protein [Candidatus Sabulitectum sp.]|nr:PAS domain-containing protein [Candidatus Sabulitectum sp.]
MSFGSNSWARLAFIPFSGEMKVDGDLFAVLGINADKLTNSTDPFSMLPDSVARGLIEGKEIVRDEELSLVIIPGKSGSGTTVTIIAEQIADFDLVVDMAGGVVGFAPDGTILRWNMRMTHLFGPREKDVKGRNASDILPDPVLYDWESVISSAHLGHEVRVEFKPSGEKRVEGVLSRGGPGVIGLFRDSTENYKTSKRLRALNRLNQAYIQSTGTGLLLLDSRLRILLSNSGFSRITGYRGSLIGLRLHDILSADSYKWVHDASEHLFAEERAEQSGVVSFINQEGKAVTLRQTLRVVRNETNQALNFICLFEDETELTLFRDEVDHQKKNLLGISRMSEEIMKSDQRGTGRICEEILRVTGSKAIAQFLYDSCETLKLAGSAGNWPRGFPVNELGEFGFPAIVWSGDKQYKITSAELGKLSNYFGSCTILPIGTGVSNQGFLVLAESTLSDSDSDSSLLCTVSSLVKIQNDIAHERSARAAAEKYLELNEGFAETLLDGIPLPIAIVRMDGRVDHWNRAMELVCGVKAGEVDSEDVNNLIDPERSGFTLDSRASGSSLSENSLSTEWAVRRKDGSKSAEHRWNVSIVDTSSGFYGDPVFLISGIRSDGLSSIAGDGSLDKLHGKKFLKNITELLSSSAHIDLLRALSQICFIIGGSGILEFSSDGEHTATFPLEADKRGHGSLSSRSSRYIQGREYHIRATSAISQETLDSVIGLLAYRDHDGLAMHCLSEAIDTEIRQYSAALTGYLEKFSSDSIEQNYAILHFLDKADPLAGFARTMLYSNETASRVTYLLRLSIQISRDDFTEEYPDRFLARLHNIFAQRSLRPPSLSLSDKMPSVLIIPEVLLQCFAMLCQLVVLDGVVSFKAWRPDSLKEPGVFLTLQGLNEPFQAFSRGEILQQLESGRFNSETEAAIIFRILEAAGCSISSINRGELTFLLHPAH